MVSGTGYFAGGRERRWTGDDMAQLEFDEAQAEQLESLYRIDDALARRRTVQQALRPAAGERILDVGCGPGFYCAELAGSVAPSGSVVGVDASAAMLALAERRCSGMANVTLREGAATSLPVDDGGFDAALSVQVLEYVPDVPAALGELHRALCPGGRLLVWDIDWATLSMHSLEPPRTARVLRAWDEHLSHPSLPRTLAPALRAAGFDRIGATAHPLSTIEFDPERFYGPAMVPFVAAFVAGRGGVAEAEAQAWMEEQRGLGARGEFSFAVTQFCFTADKAVEGSARRSG
jgi:ubiquinone/menaquinone biosynthesis C-methylase UbiE